MSTRPSPQEQKLSRLAAFADLGAKQQQTQQAGSDALFRTLSQLYGLQSDQEMLPAKIAALNAESALHNAAAGQAQQQTATNSVLLPGEVEKQRLANEGLGITNTYLPQTTQADIGLKNAGAKHALSQAAETDAEVAAGRPSAVVNALNSQGTLAKAQADILPIHTAATFLEQMRGTPGYQGDLSKYGDPLLWSMAPMVFHNPGTSTEGPMFVNSGGVNNAEQHTRKMLNTQLYGPDATVNPLTPTADLQQAVIDAAKPHPPIPLFHPFPQHLPVKNGPTINNKPVSPVATNALNFTF